MAHNIQTNTAAGVLAATVAKHPDHTAYVFEGEAISFAQLNAQVEQMALALLTCQIAHGDRVAIWAPNHPRWAVAALAAQSVGAVLVPVNTRLQGSEAGDILARSGARILFTVLALEKGNVLDMLPDVAGLQVVLLEGSDARASDFENMLNQADYNSVSQLNERREAVQGSDVADMLFTSGTTGKPKGVMCTHEQNFRTFSCWSDTVGLRQDDTYLIINPFFHSFGYKAGWYSALLVGCTSVPMRAFDVDTAMQAINTHKISMLPGAPSLYEMILASPKRADYDLSSLRLGVTGAAPVSVSLVEAMWNDLGFETVVTAYGMTESCGVISICRPEDSAELISTTAGRAIDGVEVICANPETGEEVARDEEGEIWVRGYNVMLGYFDMPQATADTINSAGWMRTGDIGVMDDAGYLKITDRLKDMYIMNGENVYPAEVEKVLSALNGVTQAAVIGVKKEPQGEVGMAFIVSQADANLTESDIKQHCADHLARYKCPMVVKFVEALPMNASGKVVKPELRALIN